MNLNVFLHFANFLAFSAIVALIVHHQTVVLNAEANATVTATESEMNATSLLNFNATDDGGQQKEKSNATATRKNHLADERAKAMDSPPIKDLADDLSQNATDDGTPSSVSAPKIAHRKVTEANWGKNGETHKSNCTTTAHFGHKNSTKNDKTAKKERMKVDSSETVEQISTENDNGNSSAERSSAEGEETHSSDEAMAQRKTTTASSSAVDEAEMGGRRRGNQRAEGNGEKGTNCENGELLLTGEKSDSPTEKGNGTATEIGTDFAETERNGRNETGDEGTERTANTTQKGRGSGRRRRRDSQDLMRQANAQIQNAFGSAQAMMQQQMPTQIIQIPSVDLSSGKAQNILLISDSGNVSMSRGLHFLTVSTVMQQ